MKILVTGGAGYIGSHFCKAAARAGHEPVVYDNLSTGHREFVQWGPLIEGDLQETAKIVGVINEYAIDTVVHFAGKAIITESIQNPDLYWDNNVEGTRSLLWAMTQAGVHKLVFSSSCTTYGLSNQPFISENHEQKPIHPYGETKLACEEMILSFQEGLPGAQAAILRYFNVVGVDPEGELWEWHEPETHVVPNTIQNLRDGQPVVIYGRHHSTRDGTCVRDYIDVNDLAQIHLAALDRLTAEQPLLISNVGVGKGYSVLDVVRLAAKAFDLEPRFDFQSARPGDPPRLVADASFFATWYPQPLRPLEQSLTNLRGFFDKLAYNAVDDGCDSEGGAAKT